MSLNPRDVINNDSSNTSRTTVRIGNEDENPSLKNVEYLALQLGHSSSIQNGNIETQSPRDNGKLWSSNSTLADIGNWLISIPRDDVKSLQNTPEYCKFLKAFEGLSHAHHRTIVHNRTAQALMLSSLSTHSNSKPDGGTERSKTNSDNLLARNKIYGGTSKKYSFLQHLAVDDVIVRVFEFLECEALVQTSRTCHRFRDLALKSATQRTNDMENSRLLSCPMKMLRAKEQVEGIAPDSGPFVRVPMLGLTRRIIVTQAGDPEYNGVYFCTSSNGNGFVFTKRRPSSVALNGSHLRCVIAKRFSNETILWYMSKEVSFDSSIIANDIDFASGVESGVTQIFSFWAKLMVIGEASPDLCRYPSQSSILSQNDQPAWQPLSNTQGFNPPVVELLE